MTTVVIVGSGLAGYTTAREFRKHDARSRLVIISSDRGASYSKPMLSNAIRTQKTLISLAMASSEQMAKRLNAEILTELKIDTIDTERQQVRAGTYSIRYDKLVLALGANPINLPIQGSAASTILSVNDLDDYMKFRAALDGKRAVSIIGGGLIGCEFANDMCSQGIAVDVYDLAPQALARLLPPQCSGYFSGNLEQAGVTFHFEKSIESVDSSDDGLRLTLSDGSHCTTDLVLSAVGLRPRLDLAQKAGLSVNRGIVANQMLLTSAPNIYAIGDCAEVERNVLPFIQPIMQAAKSLGQTLAGTPSLVHYPAMPVVVKTPACPTVVMPPAPNIRGEWQETVTETGGIGQYFDPEGTLCGFALVGDQVSQKDALAARITDLLPVPN